MIGTPSTLSSLTPTTTYPALSIADGRSCSVKGYGSTKPTPSLTLHSVLYVLGFPTNLLSISTITRTLNCVAIFYPLHWVFQDLRTGKRIGLGCENGRGIYELVSDTPSSGLLALFSSSSTISSILWHRRLSHPYLSKLKKTLPRLIIIQNHANIHLSSFSCIKAHEFHDINILIGMLLQIFEVTIFFCYFPNNLDFACFFIIKT